MTDERNRQGRMSYFPVEPISSNRFPNEPGSGNLAIDQLDRRDLQTIFEVNRKSIEIEMEVASQNEEMISSLGSIKEISEDVVDKLKDVEIKFDKIIKQNDELQKDMFKLQVLFATGFLSLVLQVVSMFVKK